MQNMRCENTSCPIGAASPGTCPYERRQVRAGTLMESQGLPSERLWYIRSGLALLEGYNAEGDVTHSALRGPGALLGLDGLGDAPLPHDIQAQTDIEACVLAEGHVDRWLGPPRTPALAVLQLALKESAARREEGSALLRGAVERVAQFLLAEHEAGNTQALDTVPRQVLARVLGLRAETFSRALRRLRDGGALTEGGSLEVASARRLREMAKRELQE